MSGGRVRIRIVCALVGVGFFVVSLGQIINIINIIVIGMTNTPKRRRC